MYFPKSLVLLQNHFQANQGVIWNGSGRGGKVRIEYFKCSTISDTVYVFNVLRVLCLMVSCHSWLGLFQSCQPRNCGSRKWCQCIEQYVTWLIVQSIKNWDIMWKWRIVGTGTFWVNVGSLFMWFRPIQCYSSQDLTVELLLKLEPPEKFSWIIPILELSDSTSSDSLYFIFYLLVFGFWTFNFIC